MRIEHSGRAKAMPRRRWNSSRPVSGHDTGLACSMQVAKRVSDQAAFVRVFVHTGARLRMAAVKAVVDTVVEENGGDNGEPASCGTAQPGEVGALCEEAGFADGSGVCEQGSLHPRCVAPAHAGYDRCGCPPGYGWSTSTERCEVDASTTDEEARVCEGVLTHSWPAFSILGDAAYKNKL